MSGLCLTLGKAEARAFFSHLSKGALADGVSNLTSPAVERRIGHSHGRGNLAPCGLRGAFPSYLHPFSHATFIFGGHNDEDGEGHSDEESSSSLSTFTVREETVGHKNPRAVN